MMTDHRIDADGDGNVTLDEMTAAAGGHMDGWRAKRFESLDANGDGDNARAEFDSRAPDASGASIPMEPAETAW